MDLSFGKFPCIQDKDAQNAFVLVASFCFEDHILSLGIIGGPLLKGTHDVQEGCVYQQPRLKLHLEDKLGELQTGLLMWQMSSKPCWLGEG